jgi:PII-like signaling protein
VRVCKRDGVMLAEPRLPLTTGGDGRPVWAKLMVYAGEQSRVSHELVRELRAAGAAGATSLRGIWGYHGDHRPHGDRFWALERHVPVVTVIVDTPQRTRGWFEIVDRLTGETGLVTSELVPAYRPRG